VYAIKARAVENLDRNYNDRNICILSDSQAAVKALANTRSPQLVWHCHHSLIQLAKHKTVQLIWLPGHEGIESNKLPISLQE
jgi:ribonuclease HI